ncbi:iron chaperone [Demequina globuliformis]|uniref:iron chaperone n=1 Tax=Demequina globuliformis TaxID=676202 RepID=UPI000782F6BE|nr:DUF1801 domain-containing protein [Demequina globuliformis]
MATPRTHDDYIESAPAAFHDVLRELRATIAATFPDADEVVQYKMPGFLLSDGTVVGYAAFTKQCGLYLPAEAIAACEDLLTEAGLKHTKTGVTFTATRPIPHEVLVALLHAAEPGTVQCA